MICDGDSLSAIKIILRCKVRKLVLVIKKCKERQTRGGGDVHDIGYVMQGRNQGHHINMHASYRVCFQPSEIILRVFCFFHKNLKEFRIADRDAPCLSNIARWI